MKESLKNSLEFYKKYTLELIDILEKNDFDALDTMLDKRQQIIDDINKMEYTKEEFLNIVEKLKILEFQKKLEILMIQKRDEVKKKMDKNQKIKNANNIYNKNLYNSMKAINKKI